MEAQTNSGSERVSVIFEGGGMRGLFTAGVIDYLISRNLYWNNVYGVSAGACHAVSYMSGQFDRARRVNINYVNDPRYSGLWCLLTRGTYFGFDFLFDTIPNKYDPIDWYRFFTNQNTERRLYITATCAETGEASYICPKTPKETLVWLAASSSLPILSKPVHADGKTWFDGGIADSIPLYRAIDEGHRRHIIVLTQPAGYRKQPLSVQTEKTLRTLYGKWPHLIDATVRRNTKYNQTLDKIDSLEREGKALVFRPPENVSVGRLCKNPTKLQILYKTGFALAQAHSEALHSF